jgi:hypothetical protein
VKIVRSSATNATIAAIIRHLAATAYSDRPSCGLTDRFVEFAWWLHYAQPDGRLNFGGQRSSLMLMRYLNAMTLGICVSVAAHPAEPPAELTVSRDDNYLTIHGERLPGGQLRVH